MTGYDSPRDQPIGVGSWTDAPVVSADPGYVARPPAPGPAERIGLRTWIRNASGLGILLIALWYVVTRHYVHTTWVIDPPVPVAWVVAAEVAYLIGMPLLFVTAGLEMRAPMRWPWRRMLLRHTAPLLVLYALALLTATAVMWRFNAGFAASRARDAGELLEQLLIRPSDAWFVYAFALFPVVARLSRGMPAVILLPAAAVAAIAGTAADAGPGNLPELLAGLFFFLIGVRWPQTVSAATALPGALRRLPVAAGGAAILVCAGMSATGLGAPLDRGLAFLLSAVALPAVLTAVTGAARRPRLRRPLAPIGRAFMPTYLVLVPVVAFVDGVVLGRLSGTGASLQLPAALVEPLALVAVVVLAGLCAAPAVRFFVKRVGLTGGSGRPRRVPTPGRSTAAAGTALLLVVQGGCAAVSPAAPSPAPSGPATAPADTELSLAFAGDVHFERRVATLLADPKTTLGEAGAVLSAADVALLNLETPITGRGTPEQKRYLFRAPAPAVQALTAAGVDAVSLANNHTLDYGSQGLLDTVAAARRGRLGVFGAGRNDAEAFTPWRRTVKGVRIAVFGFSQVDDLAETWAATPDRPGMAMAFAADRAAAAVTAARANSDLVIVMPHWGTEGDPCPNERQQAFADRMAAAGADIVVGAHSHVLQGAGYRGKTFVAYGMGNFLWYSGGLFAPFSSKTGVLVLKVRGREVVGHTLQPAVVSSTGRPRMLSGWQADLARRTFAGLRGCARLEPAAE